jgi:hypothetical protein
LTDNLQDEYRSLFSKSATRDVITHCKRELIHAIWRMLLNDSFIEAYANGFLIECADGIQRRFFPRILFYSADYPEKYTTFFFIHVYI